MIYNAMIVCAAWALLLVIANPWLENRNLGIGAAVMAAVASVLFIITGAP